MLSTGFGGKELGSQVPVEIDSICRVVSMRKPLEATRMRLLKVKAFRFCQVKVQSICLNVGISLKILVQVRSMPGPITR